MDAHDTNSVWLLSDMQMPISKSDINRREFEKDCQHLEDLFAELMHIRRELTMVTHELDTLNFASGQVDPRMPIRAYVHNIKALETAVNRLIGAIMTHRLQ